jgi:C-terminal processing protease CtpA/Prc
MRLARDYDLARTFGPDDPGERAALLAELARRIAALAGAATDSARLAVIGTTPWRPLRSRTLAGEVTPPLDTLLPGEWPRTLLPSRVVRLARVIVVWSTLRREYAHRMLADDDWDLTLARVAPASIDAKDSLGYATALRDLLSAANDSRVTLDDPTLDVRLGTAVLPFEVENLERQMVVTQLDSGAVTAGLRIGDVIERIDNDPIDRKLDAVERSFGAANSWTRRRDAYQHFLRGPRQTVATLQLRRLPVRGRAEQRDVSVARVPRESRAARTPRKPVTIMPHPGVVLLDLSQLTAARIDSLRALEPTQRPRALILDARGRVDTAGSHRLAHWLLDMPMSVVSITRRTIDSCANCGTRLTLERDTRMTADAITRFAGPVAVLIDEHTSDLAEEAVLALLRAPNATAIGSPTAGTVGPLAALALPGGYVVRYPWADVRWPDGRLVQRVGITPLLDARPTIAGVRDARDEVLEAATKWVSSFLDPSPRRR